VPDLFGSQWLESAADTQHGQPLFGHRLQPHEIEDIRDGLQWAIAADLARYYLALGDTSRAIVCGRAMKLQPYRLKYDLWWAPMRKTAEHEQFFAELFPRGPVDAFHRSDH
jgi:hypothetical protein